MINKINPIVGNKFKINYNKQSNLNMTLNFQMMMQDYLVKYEKKF